MIAATSSARRRYLQTVRMTPALTTSFHSKPLSSPSSISAKIEKASALRPLVQATLTSASAYHALSETSQDPDLCQFAAALLSQRYSICQALDRHKSKYRPECSESDKFVSSIRGAWVNSIQSLSRNHTADFVEHAENAEWLLEEAFLTVIHSLDNLKLADELREHAIAICDARQCWAEFACVQLHTEA